MTFSLFLAQGLRLLAACAVFAMLLTPAVAVDVVYPIASRLGLAVPAGLKPSLALQGFEDQENNVFIRLVALPQQAFGEIKKAMTDDVLKKQGLTVEKRESVSIGNSSGLLVIVHQETGAGRIRKWLLIAPIDGVTALVTLEIPAKPSETYTDAVVRTTLLSLTARPQVPADEQLSLLPFKVEDTAGLRIARVVPGAAVQFTDGPQDAIEATDQSQLAIVAAPGGPGDPRDRDRFARDSMNGLPITLSDLRLLGSESMRVGGQPGHEVRAQAKDAQTGIDIEIVQWLRFGTGGYIRILGFAPKDKWADAFTRFRAVRDGLKPQ